MQQVVRRLANRLGEEPRGDDKAHRAPNLVSVRFVAGSLPGAGLTVADSTPLALLAPSLLMRDSVVQSLPAHCPR